MARPDKYENYYDLASHEEEGIDFRICVTERDSVIAIIAPHGGGIEPKTSQLAGAIAGDDFNLYCFEGLKKSGNYAQLHVTSHHFNEPRCRELIFRCDTVVAIHGCQKPRGEQERICIGGRDEALKETIALRLRAAGIDVKTEGHEFLASHPQNICNRGKTGAGVQIELTPGLRRRERLQDIALLIREAIVTH